MQDVLKSFKEFKLSGMVASLEERLNYAKSNKLSHQQLLELLCEDEVSMRRENNYKKRYSASKLPSNKRLEDFNLDFQPSIDAKIVSDIATCQFIDKKEDVIFVGGPGTGKTHLSISFGLKALERGYSVRFITVSDMLNNLHLSRADNSYHKQIKRLVDYDLLILDELGFKTIPKFAADDFFNVISRRYEKKSTIITTNKSISEWNDIFEEAVLTQAITDRLLHHSTIFDIKGPSYRTKSVVKEAA